MNKEKRPCVIAGNLKMNLTHYDVSTLVSALKPLVSKASADIVLCVPFTSLQNAAAVAADTNIEIGAQNMHFEDSGAFTGEISWQMLKAAGAKYVIIGHSERRQYFAETDETVNKKVHTAVKNGLIPIVCVGESLSQREAGQTEVHIKSQVERAYLGIDPDMAKNTIIAYEPIWAIGTGRSATEQQADEVCALIRETLSRLYGDPFAQGFSILYGGSMNPANAASLLKMDNVDGGLIGGASLKADDFSKIVTATDLV